MMFVLAVLAMVCTVVVTLTAVVFCMGMGANAKPAAIRALKLWMAGLSLLGAAGVTAGIFLMCDGEPGRAAVAAFTPVVIIAVLFVVAMFRSGLKNGQSSGSGRPSAGGA
ncbi:hypothetical protein sos41_20570 [Alphaproteobacteria bacterium SO-S41]|nr:hypothetical protein sos41_20570 [Alphaproteobacteria bacterium SO-S41]